MTARVQISEKRGACPSPFVRRWRGGPDEGRPDAKPSPGLRPPSPEGRGTHGYMTSFSTENNVVNWISVVCDHPHIAGGHRPPYNSIVFLRKEFHSAALWFEISLTPFR